MKKTLRKTLSLFLAFSLLCSLGLTAAASEALGEDLTSKDTLLNRETQLSTNVFWSTAYSDLRTENVITYSPNDDVTPIVTYGGTLTSRTTVTSAARALEGQGYRVVAGINGDFFNTGNGLPIGILVSEGNLLSSDAGYYAIGFREDGSAVIGRPGVTVSADLGYQAIWAAYYDGNRKSKRVMLKCGMTYRLSRVEPVEQLGETRLAHYFAITKREWER